MKSCYDLSKEEFIKIAMPWRQAGFSLSDFESYYSMNVSLESAIKIRDINKNNPILAMLRNSY